MNENNVTTRGYSEYENIPKKPMWNDIEYKAEDGILCGEKIFYICDPSLFSGDSEEEKEKRSQCKDYNNRCAREILVRRYAAGLNMTHITKLKSIEPKELNEYLNSIEPDTISNNFFDNVNKLEEHLLSMDATQKVMNKEIKLKIEKGNISVAQKMNSLAMNFCENDAVKLFINIFQNLSSLHSVNIHHLDLKPQNMVLNTINGTETISLNDFDTSVVLRPFIQDSHYDREPRITLLYAAPEQLGLYKCKHSKKCKLSDKTDIFSASLIAYQICSEGQFPEKLNNIHNTESLNKDEYADELRVAFKKIRKKQKKGQGGWESPKNGSNELKRIILSGLNVNPNKRPSAAEMVKQLKTVFDIDIRENREEKEEGNKPDKFIELIKYLLKHHFLTLCLFVIFAAFAMWMFYMVVNKSSPPSAPEPPRPPVETTTTYAAETAINTTTTTEATTITEESTTEATEPKVTNDDKTDEIEPITNSPRTNPPRTNPPDTTEPPVTEPPTEPTTTKPERKQFKVTLVNYNGYEGYEINGFDLGFDGGELYIPPQINDIDIVGIGEGAFKENTRIKKISFPATLRYIGDNAFEQCQGLTEINISENVEVIGEKSFFDCLYIEKVFIPYNTVEIGAEAFGVSVEASSAMIYSKKRCFNVAASDPWKYTNRYDEHIFSEYEGVDNDSIEVNFGKLQ